MPKRTGSPSETVVAIGDELGSFVGKRVRLRLTDGTRREGVLASAPMTFNAVSGDGSLVKQGRIVIERAGGVRDVVELELVDTYEILPGSAR
jgi:small nuclear ribonucleoprotein (snRNP)-like protein